MGCAVSDMLTRRLFHTDERWLILDAICYEDPELPDLEFEHSFCLEFVFLLVKIFLRANIHVLYLSLV